MAKKGSGSNGKSKTPGGTARAANATASPASAAQTTAETSATATKSSRPRKPPVVRANKLATQLAKKVIALDKQTERWKGEGSEEQQLALGKIRECLEQIGAPIAELQDNIDFLLASGWNPASSGLGRKPIAVGDTVRIREKFYEPEIVGASNEFEVVKLTEKNAVVVPIDGKLKPFPIPRHYLARVAGAGNFESEARDDGETDAGIDVVAE